MKFLLDTVVAPGNRAVEFSKQQCTVSHDLSTVEEGEEYDCTIGQEETSVYRNTTNPLPPFTVHCWHG